MECNKDEAAKAKLIAEKKFEAKDVMGARKFAMKAHNLFPGLEGLQPLLATLNIYLSAERKINGEVDWYGVLGVEPSSDDETVRKQYRKLALTLHPDKNKSVGAEGAFKILSEAWSLLSDKARRTIYDQKRSAKRVFEKVVPKKPSKPVGSDSLHRSANNGNFNMRSQNAPNPHLNSVRPPQRNTFWTMCTSCKMQFEYVLFYLNKKLECYNCKDPSLKRSAFSNFIQCEGNVQSCVLACDIKRIEISVINGSWKSLDNNHLHCGVAVMRLMETYMGCAKWDLGLKKNNMIILEKLRAKYSLGIITSEVNTIQSVKEIPQKKKKQSKVSVKADEEENAEKEEPEEEKVKGRKNKRLKKAEMLGN